jgi:hypothetical protein
MQVSITEAGIVDYTANGSCQHGINMKTTNQLVWSVDFLGSSPPPAPSPPAPIICGSHCSDSHDCNNKNCPICNNLSKRCSSK